METSEVGDWTMPAFKLACTYAVSQGWLSVVDDMLTLTTTGWGGLMTDMDETVPSAP